MMEKERTTISFERLLACVDRDSLPEAPPNYPPMAAWPRLSSADKTKAASLKSDGGRRPVVYVHVPFCETLCRFCGFYKIHSAPGAVDRYLDALEKETAIMGPLFKGRPLRFLCIGGGTPSLLTIPQLERLFGILRAYFKITPKTRIAFEASPNTLDALKLAYLKAAGVEWLAIGVQSFDPLLLKALGRRQDPARTIEVIKQAKKAGILQVEVDLITGLPGQTEKSFLKDVRTTAALDVERVYLFDFQPKYRTTAGGKGGSLEGNALEDARAWRRRGMDILFDKGYKMRCGHWVYKRKGDWWPYSYDQGEEGSYSILGLGPSSVSYAMNGIRYRNVPDERLYESELSAGRLPTEAGALLSQKDEMANFVILDALHRGQVDKQTFRRRFGVGPGAAFPGKIKRLLSSGVLSVSGRSLQVKDRERATCELRREFYSPGVVRRLEEIYGKVSPARSSAAVLAPPDFNKTAAGEFELCLAGGVESLLYGAPQSGPELTSREIALALLTAANSGRSEALIICGRPGGPGSLELGAVRCAAKAGFKKVSLLSALPRDAGYFSALRSAGADNFMFKAESARPADLAQVRSASAAGLAVCMVGVIRKPVPAGLLGAAGSFVKAGAGSIILAFPEGTGNIVSDYAALRPLAEAAACSGLPVKFLRVPLCALYPHWKLSADYLQGSASGDARESGGAAGALKPKLCLKCKFLLKCPGPAKGYSEKFAVKGLKAVK